MEGAAEKSSAVPAPVLDSVNKTLLNLQELRVHLPELLSLSDPDVLSEMHPLKRAESLLLLARTTTVLFSLRLRCSGVNLDEHPIKSELERLRLYKEKLERFISLSKAPLRPSTTLNHRAATRFIEHSLPDLTPEQRQGMREISKRDGRKMQYSEWNAQKKRKYQSSEKKSVQTTAKEFLEKATLELLGDNKGGFKGPLKVEGSEGDDLSME